MTVEDRLRAALRAEAEGVAPRDESWAAIEERASAVRRRRLLRTTSLSAASIAAAVALVLGLVSVLDNGDDTAQRVRVGNESEQAELTTTTSPRPTTTSTVVTAPPAASATAAVWDRTFSDPEKAARAFATEYLAFANPTVVASDADAQYLVRAKSGRGPFTRVTTGFRNGAWVVTGAASDNLQLTTPSSGTTISSPVQLRGRSRSFEATVSVEVRQVNQTRGQNLQSTFFTGGGGGPTLEPFATSVSFKPSATATGAVLLLTYSAEDGTLAEATVVPVRFRTG